MPLHIQNKTDQKLIIKTDNNESATVAPKGDPGWDITLEKTPKEMTINPDD